MIMPEDAWNPVRHRGSKQGFPPSIAVQIAALEFANSVWVRSGPPAKEGGSSPWASIAADAKRAMAEILMAVSQKLLPAPSCGRC
jgi:hypothetical protein